MRRTVAVGVFILACVLPVSAESQILPMGIPHLCAQDAARTVIAVGAVATLSGSLSCVEVRGTATVTGTLTVKTILAYQGSDLAFADGSTTIIRDAPIDAVNDPEQWGHGIVAFGKVRAAGQAKTQFVRLGAEPLAGATTLTLSVPVSGWQAGDRVFLSDTRQVPDTQWFNQGYALQHETATIASVNGLSVTLTGPLAFTHRGARNADGTIFTLPHVANLTRSIKIRSENPNGVRGHIAFIGRADVNLSGVEVSDMGRTTTAPLDSTSLSSGTVTHRGTNQIGRYPVHFHMLSGPVNPTNTGYQYQFVGNVIRDSRKWPLAIHASHYGLVEGNVIVGGAELTGAGIALEDGSETENLIRGNFVASIRGHVNPNATRPSTLNGTTPGAGGECVWAGFNNRFVNNVVTGCRNAAQNVAAGPGFKFVVLNVPNPVRNPKIRGADLNDPTQYVTVQPMRQPLLQFDGNEAYGLMATGLTIWYLGTNGYDLPTAPESIIKDFTVWHAYDGAAWLYPTNHLTFDGLRYRVDPSVGGGGGIAIQAGDYRTVQLMVRNADIHGTAVFGSLTDPLGAFLFENVQATTRQHAYQFRTPSTPGSGAVRPSGVTMTIRGGLVLPWPGTGLKTISMLHTLAYANSDTTHQYRVKVENYQGIGAAFDVFFPIQLNANLYGGFAPCGNTTTRPEIQGITCGSTPPPPVLTAAPPLLSTAVATCTYTFTAVPPDATGGWTAQFQLDGVNVASVVTLSPAVRAARVVWTKGTLTVTSPAVATSGGC